MRVRDIKVKDIYGKVQSEEVSKYKFMVWLRLYGFKHWEKGFSDGFNSGARDGK